MSEQTVSSTRMNIFTDTRASTFMLGKTLGRYLKLNDFTSVALGLNTAADLAIADYCLRHEIPYTRWIMPNDSEPTPQHTRYREAASETVVLEMATVTELPGAIFVVTEVAASEDGSMMAVNPGSMLDVLCMAFDGTGRAINVILPPELGMVQFENSGIYGRRPLTVTPDGWKDNVVNAGESS